MFLSPTEGDVGPIVLMGDPIHIPHRIYNSEVPDDVRGSMGGRRRAILDWLYTRHHDGYVRESSLRRAMPALELWMAPFVVQLVGEYVIEILYAIEELLTDDHESIFGGFALENQGFLELTRSRVASYWNCYYRARFPRRDDYVGYRLMHRLDQWTQSSATSTA